MPSVSLEVYQLEAVEGIVRASLRMKGQDTWKGGAGQMEFLVLGFRSISILISIITGLYFHQQGWRVPFPLQLL